MDLKKKDGGVEAPVSLSGLFFNPDDSDNDENDAEFDNSYESQRLDIGGLSLDIKQNAWHQTNANKVWPGTFLLADFLKRNSDRYNSGDVPLLELGSATGALAIFLRINNFSVITCDIDDGGEVEANIHQNEVQNGLSVGSHIAHTWGAEWQYAEHIKFIVASDILLYVSAYASLVRSLVRMFETNGVLEFVMAWNRRISESGTFFDMMREAGFLCHHHGKCVYSFYRPTTGHTDSYLDGLAVSGAAENACPSGMHIH